MFLLVDDWLNKSMVQVRSMCNRERSPNQLFKRHWLMSGGGYRTPPNAHATNNFKISVIPMDTTRFCHNFKTSRRKPSKHTFVNCS